MRTHAVLGLRPCAGEAVAATHTAAVENETERREEGHTCECVPLLGWEVSPLSWVSCPILPFPPFPSLPPSLPVDAEMEKSVVVVTSAKPAAVASRGRLCVGV